jgi:hypothetical protein
MSWMKEVAAIIEQASLAGVELTLDDFSREGDQLTIDGMPVDEWLSMVHEIGIVPVDRMEDLDI